MGGFISSFFKPTQEGCEVRAEAMFDANKHKIESHMQKMGEDSGTIATQVARQKEEYVSSVCKRPPKGPGM